VSSQALPASEGGEEQWLPFFIKILDSATDVHSLALPQFPSPSQAQEDVFPLLWLSALGWVSGGTRERLCEGCFPPDDSTTNTSSNACSLHPCARSCCFASAASSPAKLNTCCADGNTPRREEGKEQAGAHLAAFPGQRRGGALAPGPVVPSRPHEQPGRADGWGDPTAEMQSVCFKLRG